MDRMKQLIKILNEANELYYQKNTEKISNMEYDKLYDELVELEKKSGLVYSKSPTNKVGYTVLSNLVKVKHDSKMLSLDKTKEVSKLKSFLADKTALLSWKLDGLTIVLKYENGKLTQAITRGNGEIGEDVTHNAKVFKNIPLEISYTGTIIIRGEAVIGNYDFKKINENLGDDEQYKNPRNLCSGTVRQLNSEVTASRNVKFFAFSLLNVNDIDFSDKKSEQLKWLDSLGFEVVEYKMVDSSTIENTVLYFKEKILSNDFGSDGLVLTYNDLKFSDSLGNTSKFPKDSIAFKWADEIAETTLLDIQWNTSRTGLINPIAVFEPVELEGTTVNKASLHNVSILENLELGIGDIIKVYKANMIIPQVSENITRSATAIIPTICPVCKFETEIVKQKDVKALYCLNPNCKAQLIRSLSHFSSRDAMNIEGLSESTIEKLVEKGFLDTYIDIFFLEKYEEEIKNMEGFGQRSYTKLIASIEKSKDVQLPNFIYSLGISQVGLSNSKLLCNHYKYDTDKIKNSTEEELISIEGYGDIIAKSITHYFKNETNMLLFNKALTIIRILKIETNEEQKLSNITFVITGNIEKFESRKELQSLIEKLGGKVTSSVTAKTSYLINNDISSTSSKNKKANDLNIPIINEDEFIKLFNFS